MKRAWTCRTSWSSDAGNDAATTEEGGIDDPLFVAPSVVETADDPTLVSSCASVVGGGEPAADEPVEQLAPSSAAASVSRTETVRDAAAPRGDCDGATIPSRTAPAALETNPHSLRYETGTIAIAPLGAGVVT